MPGFLNLTALFGLAAAFIPLILHLLNRKRKIVIEFSSLRFLKQLEKREMNRLRLKRLLLLLIRTLTVISIVLAFSRPTIRGYLPGASISTNAVILIDNSLSMQMKYQGISLFDRSLQTVTEILATFDENDQLLMIPTVRNEDENSSSKVWRSPANVDLKNLNVSFKSSDLGTAIRDALEVLNGETSANKELFILSDFQRNSVAKSEEFIEGLAAALHIYLIEIRSNETNYSLNQVDVISKVLRKGSNARIGVEVHGNSGEIEDVRLDLFIGGTRVGQSIVNPTVDNDEMTEFLVPVKSSGFISGFAELGDDALMADNRRYFHLYIPEQIKVLGIGKKNDLFFSTMALRTSLQAELNSELKIIRPAEINRVVLSDYDVILLSDIPESANRFAQHLKEFIKAGGGLLILPGGEFDIRSFNAYFSPELNLPKITGIKQSAEHSEEYISFGSIRWNHPLFIGIFSQNKSELNYPKVKKYYTIDELGGGEDLVTLDNDRAFIKEYRLGEGHIIMMFAAPILEWSDFPLKGLWVPFVSRAVEYAMTGQSSFIDSVSVGSHLSIDIDSTPLDKKLTARTPNGKIFSLFPETKGNKIYANFKRTDIAGTYLILQDDKVLAMKSVNIDRRELARRSEISLYSSQFKNEFVKVSSVSEIGKEISESRLGVELWRLFAVLAFLLLISEMVVQNVKVDETVKNVVSRNEVEY